MPLCLSCQPVIVEPVGGGADDALSPVSRKTIAEKTFFPCAEPVTVYLIGAEPAGYIAADTGVLRDQRVPQVHHLPVHRDALHLPVRKMQNAPARRLIHTPRLHAHKPVLHQVNAPNPVLPAKHVELFQQ